VLVPVLEAQMMSPLGAILGMLVTKSSKSNS
jgi:hypothetical protein